MRTCPGCKSLVPPEADECPEQRANCPLFSDEASVSESAAVVAGALDPLDVPGAEPMTESPESAARSTIQLSPDQIRELLPAQAAKREPAPESTTPDSSVAPASGSPARANQAARLGFQLGALSIVPLFPIGFVAVMVSLIGLTRARDFEQPERQKAWAGLFAGAIFGTVWLVLTLWLLNDIIIDRP